MHFCPDCGEPCFCDFDDTDFGDYPCKHHFCREIDEYETYDEYIMYSEEERE